jgi:murein DD-endopeptidase MepM/ murein hydrolase activator NlpD
MLSGGLALGITPLLVGRATTAAAAVDSTNKYNTPDVRTKLVRPIMYPIVPAGRTTVNRLRNYGQNRGSHIHAGEDMMAAKLSLLLAVTDATVVRKVYGSGGNYLYLRDADGYIYGYLHINNDSPGTDDGKNPAAWAFAPGIVEGAKVKRGQQIAWVGDSGNAENTGSHLHFEIRKPNVKWYWAQAIDPEPSLDAAAPAVPGGSGTPTTSTTTTTTTTPPPASPPPASPFAPFDSASAFAIQQSRDFLGRTPTASWTATAGRSLSSGSTSPESFIERQLADAAVTTVVNPVIRLYTAYFGGIPTYAGVNYWVNAVRKGTSLDSASAQMVASSKFKSVAGQMDNAAFARRIHRNLFGVEPSAQVVAEMKLMLDSGLSRGALTRAVCESSKYRMASAPRTRVISVYHAMLRRSPTQTWLTSWSAADKARATGMASLIKSIRTGAEYAKRIG